MTEKQIRLLQVVLLVIWPVTAYASAESLGQTFGAIKSADWAVVFLLSSFSGLVALLQRIRKNFEARALEQAGLPFESTNKLLIDIRFYALCHMTASLAGGFIAFIFCEYQDLNTHMEALMIAGFAWSGATAADRIADRLVDTVTNKITTIFGKPE